MDTISNLSINDFKKVLEQETKFGHPRAKGNPLAVLTMFGQASRQFYGIYDKDSFQLTKNATLRSVPYR